MTGCGPSPGCGSLEGQEARGLLTTPDRSRVTGVRHGSPDSNTTEAMAADLVVDATGRRSRSPQWLADLGYPSPDEVRLEVGVHYTTRLFRREPGDLEDCQQVVVTIPPGGNRGGVLVAVEGDRWLVTLVGLLGERPPADLAGFIEYASTLWVDDLHQVVAAAEPLGEAATGGFPGYLRRRYDRLRRFPDRFVVTGDAVCSFNPVYAQGMSVAIIDAVALGRILDKHGLDRVGPRFFKLTKRTVDAAWMMSTGADLGHPGVDGPTAGLVAADQRLHQPPPGGGPPRSRSGQGIPGGERAAGRPPQHLMRPRFVAPRAHRATLTLAAIGNW